MRAREILFTALFFLGLPWSSGEAMELRSPLELETAATLPSGIRNPRFKSLFMTIQNRFDGSGGTTPLGNRLNKAVTWQDVIDGQGNDDLKAQVNGLLRGLGFKISDSPGSTTGIVNVGVNAQVPVAAYGITDAWTLAVAVPVVQANISADTGFVRSDQGQAFVDDANNASGPLKAEEAANKLNTAINQKLTRLGYEPVQSKNVSGIGDVRLVSKYAVYRRGPDAVTLKNELTLPTGAPPNSDLVVDVPLGDGQWDLGAGAAYDREWTSGLFSNVYANYLWQIPSHLARRLPVSPTDFLSSDKDPNVFRKIGDQIQLGASVRYYVPQWGVTVGSGYAFQKQFRTRYEGSMAYDTARYVWLEAANAFDMPMDLHSAVLSAGFSSIDFYRQQKFPLPMQVNLVYSKPFAGSNAMTNDLVAGEMTVFF